MLTLLHSFLARGKAGTLLDFVLPRMVADFQSGFCRFADCGAGIGHTSAAYGDILRKNLRYNAKPKALVACYEPLPENFAELSRKLAKDPVYALRKVAVSDVAGSANFQVPSRLGKGGADWTEGTSYDGFLSKDMSGDHVAVEVVRLRDERAAPFDFVKLDLQGGELKAIQGLGDMLPEVKLLYVETQLLSADGSARYLNEQGFVTFFDSIQFGFKGGTAELPMKLLADIGFSISRIRLPDSTGFPLICWGHFKPDATVFDPTMLNFRKDIADDLRAAGVNYMQTDTLAFNSANFARTMRYFV